MDWGSGGRWFESSHPDQFSKFLTKRCVQSDSAERFERRDLLMHCQEVYREVPDVFTNGVNQLAKSRKSVTNQL